MINASALQFRASEPVRTVRRIPHANPRLPKEFSLEPVVRLLSPAPARKVRDGLPTRGDGELAIVALRLGIARQNVRRYLRNGVDAYQADAIAIELG